MAAIAAGVGLLVVCGSSSAAAAMMMMGGDDKKKKDDESDSESESDSDDDSDSDDADTPSEKAAAAALAAQAKVVKRFAEACPTGDGTTFAWCVYSTATPPVYQGVVQTLPTHTGVRGPTAAEAQAVPPYSRWYDFNGTTYVDAGHRS